MSAEADTPLYVLKKDCEKQHKDVMRQHKDNRRRVWWLASILVGLSALMIGAIAQGWSASNRADSVERHVQQVDDKIDVQTNYLEKTLTVIRDDVREIRATQQRMARNNGG